MIPIKMPTKELQHFADPDSKIVAEVLDMYSLDYWFQPELPVIQDNKIIGLHPDFYLPKYHTAMIVYDEMSSDMLERDRSDYINSYYHFVPIQPHLQPFPNAELPSHRCQHFEVFGSHLFSLIEKSLKDRLVNLHDSIGKGLK